MCGILCLINNGKTVHPSCFPSLSQQDDRYYWESNDLNYIKENFVDRDLNDIKLSKADERKLNNIEDLRDLNNQLIKLKNNIKNIKEIEDKRLLIESKINQIIAIQEEEEEVVEEHELTNENLYESLVFKISSRGPDYLNYTQFFKNGYNFQLFSSILSLRQPFTKQPKFVDNLILQFNGELYNEECLGSNDTEYIIRLLHQNLVEKSSRQDAVLKTLSQLIGEFSFVLIDTIDNLVYFGRDFIGRRSLMYSLSNQLIISSLPPRHNFDSFIDCSNQIYIYNWTNNQLINKDYKILWDTYHLINEKISFNPLTKIFDFENDNLHLKIQQLYEKLNKACLVRQLTIHPLNSSDSHLGILFSGGLDCTILASLISENLISQNSNSGIIDLITVGFDNPRLNQLAGDSPDRKLSKKSWFYLSKKYNSKDFKIRLVEVNVNYQQWLSNKSRVKKLMYPNLTEMDLSIAIAFYFASKYEGTKLILNNTDVEFDEFLLDENKYTTIEYNYKSNTKVLFSGLGADELFAGYSRHESLFNSIHSNSSNEEILKAYEDLSSSLIYDITVIHTRNLGRDDRVISSWGKELRYPYLDNNLINFVINEIEPNLKFFYQFETIINKKNKDGKIILKPIRKFLLRELADYLGLTWVKYELKRAIQFGSKSAKLEIGQGKVKGTDSL